MRLSRLPRDVRRKNGSDEWANYYQSVNGQWPSSPIKRRNSRRSGLFRMVTVLVILAVLMVAREYPHPVGDQVRDNLRHLLAAEWDFQPALQKSMQLAAQLVNWDNPVGFYVPDASEVTELATAPVLKREDLSVPVSGKVVEQFGWAKSSVDDMERFHHGIDISAPVGKNITAAMDGRVERVGEDKVLGQFILIKHEEGMYTLYGGIEDTVVVEGQYLRAGEEIAVVGESNVPGGGLHFELREKGELVDPLTRLQVNGN